MVFKFKFIIIFDEGSIFLFEIFYLLLQIFILALKESNELCSLFDSLFHNFSLSLLSPHRYYIIQFMSFEFANRIELLTAKLTEKNHSQPKQSRIQQAKEQLIALQAFCNKELKTIDKRMMKAESKLKRRIQKVSEEQQSVESIWGFKEERVTQVIGGWVNEYQQKVQHALEELRSEEITVRSKLEQQDQIYERQARIMQEKIHNKLKILERELIKWDNINVQNHSYLLKQIANYRQSMSRQLFTTNEVRGRQIKAVQSRLKKLKQKSMDRISELQDDLGKRGVRTDRIFHLLLQIK